MKAFSNGFDIKLFLKVLVLIVAVIGAAITLCNLLGCFTDKDRLHIYNQLLSKSAEYRVPVDTPGVTGFLERFFYSKKAPTDMQSIPIKGLALSWIALGNNQPTSGSVHVEFQNGQRTTALCRLDELKQWSSETQFYAWLGWCLLAISVLSQIIIFVLDFRERNQQEKKRGE
jgi:hypothetical protein